MNLFIETQKVIDAFGGVRQISNRYGVTKHAIYMWPEVITGTRANRVQSISSILGIDISQAIINPLDVKKYQLKKRKSKRKPLRRENVHG